MSGSDVVDLGTLGSCYVSQEASFCVAGTERRCYPIAGSIDYEMLQTEIDRKQLAINPNDIHDPVFGFKEGSVKLGYYLQPAPQVLVTGASVDTDANCPLAVFVRCVFGGQSVFAGTTVLAASGAVDGFSTAAGHGGRLPAGQLCLVTDPDAAIGLVPARVTSQIVDVIEFYPEVSGALANGSAVVNMWTFYPASTNAKTLSVALCAAQDATHQARLSGCTGSIEIKVERDGLAQILVDLKAATWVGPSALGLSIADAVDPMAPPLSCRSAVMHFQSKATTTRTAVQIDSATIKLNFGNKHVETLTGGTEGKRSAMRLDGLLDTFADIELTFALDPAVDTLWRTRTEMFCMLWLQIDDVDGHRRSVTIDVPRAIFVGKPPHKPTNNLIKTTAKLRAKRDNSCAQVSELATAPFRLGLG